MGRLSPLAVAAMAALFVMFGTLSAWQFLRAGEKAVLESEDARRSQIAPIWVHSGQQLRDMHPGRRVKMCGTWLRGAEVLLDNRPHDSRPGYQVFAAMRLRDGTGLMAFRGWMPAVADRDSMAAEIPSANRESTPPDLPAFEVAACPRPARVLEGALWRPDRRPIAVDEDLSGQPGPWVEQQLRLPQLASRLQLPMAELVVWSGWPRKPLQAIPRPPVAAVSSDRHRAYALTWLLLAVAVLAIGAGLALRRES